MRRDKAIERLRRMKTEVGPGSHWSWSAVLKADALTALQALTTPGRIPEYVAHAMQEPIEGRYDLDELVVRLDDVAEQGVPGKLTWRLVEVLERSYAPDEVDEVAEELWRTRGPSDPMVLTLYAGIARTRQIRRAPDSTRTADWTPERIWCELVRKNPRYGEIETAIEYQTSAAWAALQVEALGLFATPEAAAVMWALFKARGKATGPARAWLLEHPDVVEPMLVEAAAGGFGSGRARRFLASLRGRREAPAKGWLHPADLPEAEHVEVLLDAVKRSTLVKPDPRLAKVDPNHELAWALFETWLDAGAPAKDGWVMWALGLLGNDLTALALGPLMKRWPKERQNARALKGLRVLEHLGTDNALATLASVARTARTASLKQHAQDALEAIAERRGLDIDELQDRLVPTCGIGEVLDYGTRSFPVVLRPDLRLAVEVDGERKTSPPRARKTDTSAKAARQAWTIHKKALSTSLKEQRQRLEQALAEGRPWSPAAFAFVLEQPLLSVLARQLIWRPEGGEPFRIAEDGSFADIDDDPVDIEGAVRLLHPVELPAKEIAAWAEICSDYELLPPFDQLGRPCRRLEADERDLRALPIPEGFREPWMGWTAIQRNPAWIRPGFEEVFIRTWRHHEGWQARLLASGWLENEPPEHLVFARFPGAPPEPLSEVPPRVLSEAWRSAVRAFG